MTFKTIQPITTYSFLFGSRLSLGNNEFGVFYDSSFYTARYQTNGRNYQNGQYSTDKTRISLGKDGYAFNGNRVNINGNIEKKNNLYIFGMNTGDVFGASSSYQLYECTITDEDILVRDYVPVKDKNNRPCLFDKVENKCYYNQGTGEFLYG